MKRKITNSLKPRLKKNPSEVGYWELNEMLGTTGCLRQREPIGYLRWVISFWISDVKQYEEIMARNSFEQSQNGRGAIKSMKWHTQKVGGGVL